MPRTPVNAQRSKLGSCPGEPARPVEPRPLPLAVSRVSSAPILLHPSAGARSCSCRSRPQAIAAACASRPRPRASPSIPQGTSPQHGKLKRMAFQPIMIRISVSMIFSSTNHINANDPLFSLISALNQDIRFRQFGYSSMCTFCHLWCVSVALACVRPTRPASVRMRH